MSDCLQFLRELGDLDTLTQMAAQGASLTDRPAFNSHVHFPPNFSAFDSVDQAIDMAADQGIGVLGTGNYYDYSIYQDFVTLARAKGIFPTPNDTADRNVPLPLPNNTETSSDVPFTVAKSHRPSPLKSPVAMACGARPTGLLGVGV